MSRDIVPTCVGTSFHLSRSAVGLVVTSGVEHQLADELPVLGEHPDPQTVDQHDHPRAGEPAPEPDAVQPGVVTQGDHPGDVDLVPPHSHMRGHLEPHTPRGRLGAGGEGLGGGSPADRAVGSHGVVVVAKRIQLSLQLADRRGGVPLGQVALEVWWNRSTFPQVWGW